MPNTVEAGADPVNPIKEDSGTADDGVVAFDLANAPVNLSGFVRDASDPTNTFPDVRVVAVDTVGSVYAHYKEHGELPPSEQIKPYLIDGIGEDFLPETVWWDTIDEILTVDDKTAYRATMELARKEAIFGGSSSGAAAAGAREVAESLPDDAVVVTLFPDSGERYLSKLNKDWMGKHGLLAESED